MKKSFLFLQIILSCLFCSCSSDNSLDVSAEPEQKLYDVVFNVEGFDVEANPLRSSVGKYATYRVYLKDSSNYSVRFSTVVTEKELTPSDFSNRIVFKLPKGSYKFVVYASDAAIGGVINAGYSVGGSSNDYNTAGIRYQDISKDLFHGDVDFYVKDENITQNMVLERPISKINLAIEDLAKMPATVKTVVPVIYNVSDGSNMPSIGLVQPLHMFLNGAKTQFFLGWSMEVGFILPYQKIAINATDLHLYGKDNPISFNFPQNQNYRFLNGGDHGRHDLYLVGIKDEEVTAEALMYGNPNIAYSKLLRKDIQLIPNQSITIAGKIFNNSGISLSVNDSWDGEINKEF